MTAVPQKIGKYVIDELLGRGGMGEVYKAQDPTLGRFVALKMMRGPALDDTNARERFIREAQAAGGLRHPNIVTVYDLGEYEGQMYIAMEFIRGDDLEKIIQQKSPLTIQDKLNIMVQVCEGVDYAHKHQIVHRDLKPSNIRIDEEGIAKIMDFGIAKLGSSTMTASGTVMGTPFYMSPEQVRGLRVDARSDLFSLGAILYELFSYQKAFTGEMTAVFYKIAHEPALPLSEYMDVPSESLQKIVDRCLEKDKNNRIQTAGELADMLRQAQEEFERNQAGTLCGIKTMGPVSEEAATEFHLTPAPAAISTKGKVQTRPAVNAGSAPTQLSDHAGGAPSGSEPTRLETPNFGGSAPPPSAVPAPGPATPAPVVSSSPGMSRGGLLAALLIIVLVLGGGAGAYFYFIKNHPTPEVAQQQKQQPQGPNHPQQQKQQNHRTGESQQKQQPPADNSSVDLSKEIASAKQLYQDGKYEEASAEYSRLLEKNPADPQLHFLLGAANQKLQKNQAALLEFQKAVENDPKMAKAWQQIGYILMNRMDYPGALNAFKKAIENDAQSGGSWEGLAQTYLITQQNDKAEEAYKKLLEIEPDNITGVYNLGQLQWYRKDTAGAKDAFQKVLKLNPNYAEAHNNLGAIYLSEQKVEQAIDENEKAVQLKPSLASAHYSLYLAYDQRKDYRQAAEHLREYLRLSPDDEDAPKLKKKLEEYKKS